ncbi:MAG: glycosyltransferase [Eubacteriales bacterium]|nr:glycosyltransferase [Eubacteriales bacterium]
MKKVHILLSTYNGEKYIADQMESLLKQEYSNFKIIIRDDGSSDETVSILSEYQEKYPEKIVVHEGVNVGWMKSFQWLIKNAGEADYYAFCDQDDVWGNNKIKHAVDELSKVDKSIPALYLSDFVWCDGDMNRKKRNAAYLQNHTLVKYITLGDNNILGFTETFNKAALDGVKNKKCLAGGCPHDDVLYLYCLLKGVTIWGVHCDAAYRRHGDNASTQDLRGGNYLSHFLWRISYFILEDHREEMYKRFRNFYCDFLSELTDEQKKIFKLYLGKKGRIKKTLQKCRYKDKWTDEMFIRILFLLGKA